MISSNAIAFKEISATHSSVLEEPFLIGTARISITGQGAVAALPDFTVSGSAVLSLTNTATVIATTRDVTGNAILDTTLVFNVASPNVVTGGATLELTSSSYVSGVNQVEAAANISLTITGTLAATRVINNGVLSLTLTASGQVSAPTLVTALANISLDIVAYLRSASIFNANDITTFVINTSTGGHAVYTNQPVSSYFKVGNKYYGTTSTGLIALEGDLVDTWIAKTPLTNLGSSKLKMIPDCYVDARLSDTTNIELSTGEELIRSAYLIQGESGTGLRRRRVKTHKGLRAVHWQTQLSGISDSEVNRLEVTINETQRSI